MSTDVRPLDERIRQIKLRLRAAMNGPVSQSLRQSGLNYRLIYGVEWPRLMQLASEEQPDEALAQALWHEDIRECHLLALLLYPRERFSADMADIWIEQMRFPEEAQYAVLTQLCHLPEASDKAFAWIADPRDMFQLCGWLLLTRLFMNGCPLMPQSEDEFIDQATAAAASSNASIRSAVGNAVAKYALIGDREALRVSKLLRF